MSSPAPILVDSHCHLPLIGEQTDDLDQIIKNADEAGVGHMLCISIDLDNYHEINEIASKHDHISTSIGVHPNTECKTEPTVEQIIQIAKSDHKIIAIGETGLDYFRSTGDMTWQQDRFVTHIEAARQLNKPLIIHTRDAADDTMQMLKEYKADECGAIMHCFVEDYATAKKALDLGFYISFSGIVTFKNAQQVQEVAEKIPMEKMLIETDAPYLAPVPKRGKMNQPAYVRHVAEFIAELRNLPVDDVIRTTTDNFFGLFSELPRPSAA